MKQYHSDLPNLLAVGSAGSSSSAINHSINNSTYLGYENLVSSHCATLLSLPSFLSLFHYKNNLIKVKDMNNDHICRLIGICLEPGHQYIVNEYCPRGSLQDFLRKEQFTMEWMFKLSLIQDICRVSFPFAIFLLLFLSYVSSLFGGKCCTYT